MKKWRWMSYALTLGFLLGVKNGYIALWKDGCTEPVRVFPYRAQSLPLRDQQALEQGIRVEDEESLVGLLEDYLS